MARRSSSTIQEELYAPPEELAREELDDARLLDLDAEKESPFLRAQKRVPVRRSPLPRKTATKLLWVLLAVAAASLGTIALGMLYHYGEHSWRFRLESSDDIEMVGLNNVTRRQVMEVMGDDIGRNVFFIPLEQRRKQLAQIPWVESASVMRFAPNRLRIEIQERAPVAFARIGSKVMLVDAGGVLMDLSTKKKYSFPVIVGMHAEEPLSTRAARMKIYNDFIRQLDSGGGHYSEDISEVDLSDPEDVKALVNDPQGEVLVHLQPSNYLDQFKVYEAHLREWRQQYPKLESVDLRYWGSARQIIVNPDLRGTLPQPALSAAATRAALSAGVKPTALVGHEPARFPVAHASTVKASPKPVAKRASVFATSQKPRSAVARTAPSRWHKRAHSAKAASKPAGPVAASMRSPAPQPAAKPQPPAPQKPSPAITKGQGNR